MKVIALLTDFGQRDWFVGSMKGVILRIATDCQIVDITHEIPPGDIFAGAFSLASSFHWFPKGTIHVSVVDPGVGTDRAPIAIATDDYVFVGPDNGLLSLAVANQHVRGVRRLDNSKLFMEPVSQTFHGRDVFAPVAAHLAARVIFDEVGAELRDYVRLQIPCVTRLANGTIAGEVIYIDRFGNAITNIRGKDLDHKSGRSWVVKENPAMSIPIGVSYQSVAPGQPVALMGSSGFLEIAVRDGDAAQLLQLRRGNRIVISECQS